MNIIVVGCGRVGSQLAMLFSDRQDDVAIIDMNIDSFASLGRNYEGRTIVGVGFDEDVLLEAGIEECDVLVAATDIDNTNLMISEVGRRLFGVPHVLSRLYNPDRESAYMQLGIDYACGTTLVAEEMYSKVVAGHGSHVDTFGDFEVLRFSLDLDAEGAESIKVGELERDHEIRIIAFERKDTGQSSIPAQESVLHAGDIVLACVRVDLIDRFKHYMVS
ncbi:MAG: TrkA family potassium uptake protein [Coriobacteriales bacterium]|jgi:trk system potassium uptake protein TrkA|nr:TrkA family potassium uptake protein [Coriobacteriales bacterium]